MASDGLCCGVTLVTFSKERGKRERCGREAGRIGRNDRFRSTTDYEDGGGRGLVSAFPGSRECRKGAIGSARAGESNPAKDHYKWGNHGLESWRQHCADEHFAATGRIRGGVCGNAGNRSAVPAAAKGKAVPGTFFSAVPHWENGGGSAGGISEALCGAVCGAIGAATADPCRDQ